MRIKNNGVMEHPSKQLMNLVRRMDSGNAREMNAAREELEQMGPLAVTRLIAELQKTPKVGKKMSMLLLGARIVLLPALLVGVVIAAVLALIVATDGSVGCIGDLGCMGDLFTGWNLREQYHEGLHGRQWNRIARALAQVNDLRVVGPLAEALDYADASTRPRIMAALHRLVPQLTVEAASALTPGQRAALYYLLEAGNDHRGMREIGLSLALLRVPVLAEDVQALNIVERVSATSSVPEVAQAAAQTLEQLKAIAQRQEVSHSLLRGSQAPVAAPETLLRPAQAGVTPQLHSQPEQLLRAVASNDSTSPPHTNETP